MLLRFLIKILSLFIRLVGFFIKDTPILMAENTPFKAPALAYSLAALPLIYPIQNVQPDDIVKAYHHEQSYYATADNSNDPKLLRDISGWQDYDYLNITPETWQIGTFEIIEATGSKVEVEANRPKTWYKENNSNAIGDKAWFYMPEIGINGEATLLSIRPTVINTTNFPLNESGMVDRPVITTFKRNAPVVYDYHFCDGSIIGATPEHPFFSVDRYNYIAVGELQHGEQIMTAGEKVVKFISGKQRDRGEPVYNFEVWREHNYYVGSKESGEFLLVHNSCWDLLKDMFKLLGIHFNKAVKISNKKWVHKVSDTDTPLPKQIELAEIIGEFKQEIIVLAKEGSKALDAVSENADLISMKALDGLTAQSNIDAMRSNIGTGISKWKNF
jgi:hypothetical protein